MPNVKTTFVDREPAEVEADLLVVGAAAVDLEKGRLRGAQLQALDRALGGVLAQQAAAVELEPKPAAELVVHTHGKLPATQVAVLGIGGDAPSRDGARLLGARAVRLAERTGARRVALEMPWAPEPSLVQAAAEGAQLGAYRFDKYMSEKKPHRLRELQLCGPRGDAALRRALALGTEVGDAVNFARDLVNEPAAVMTPTALAAAAEHMAKGAGLGVEVLEKKDIAALRMGMFLGVAQGSHQPPKLIHLWWKPRGKAGGGGGLAFVGKAITFDSGGLSIKTAEGMESMKTDMAGSAAVIAAMRVVAHLAPPFPVHAYVGACENMPSGTAQRPGDIVRARNGKTVEVLNTDAEGRLVLGDVMAWAAESSPGALVDVATLTGAITVAIGPWMTGLFASDDTLAGQLLAAAARAGEPMWRMPLPDDMKELIRSPVADLKNTGGRKGGAVTAALFLREFTGGRPWAHLDIAASATVDKERRWDARGATGVAVRTLVELVRARGG